MLYIDNLLLGISQLLCWVSNSFISQKFDECLICDIILHAIHVANVRTEDITSQRAFCWIVCSRPNLNVLTLVLVINVFSIAVDR